MQSSLSSLHGRRGIPLTPNTNPSHPAARAKPLQFIFSSSNKPSPSLSSSTSHAPILTHISQSQPPPNEPIWASLNTFTPTTRNNRTARPLPPLHCGISSDSYSADDGRSLRDWIEVFGEALSTAFPIWVALGCLLGLFRPSSFNWVQPKFTILGITLTMLGMGMTLTIDDLRGALAMPKELLAGFVLQYSVMPISGFLVSKLLKLPSYYAAGLILVACCPGGTASNIVTYIARGNVALSVLMTAASTLSAVVGHDSLSHGQTCWAICCSRCSRTSYINAAGCASSCIGWCTSKSVFSKPG
ncbi:hypothetical protein L1049_000662 [Liquidambar formosana]|uniref:Uncharacterized protein n=1 Tax=Liquidambar formosana TaxID=63359 RepID=A0AAP0NAZ2_LIQFO